MSKQTSNKTKRNCITISDNFGNAMDNIVDNMLICNRTDVLKHLVLEYDRLHPDKRIFKNKLNTEKKPIVGVKDTPLVFISDYEIAPTGRVCSCGHQQHKHVKGKTVCYPGDGSNCDCKQF